ncbi:hypothetical protein PSCICO_07420 [Pseudomonas cichorii]|uniref:Uncharacterized protein n=1 Tax=Pseudomonas serbiensis TaxID=3064350 RepID=A0ABT9CPX2_9PSED|nr:MULTISPECIES: hypothetical protein [Pseudomonas]MDO7927539.1 hypothetical protein [Pseudomonas sp. KFB-138]GFM79897.1 hypothetical protein PSCICN_05890 [Pseudomonas cichorii]GFM85343.1 hypothetical protein PSCICO_07420 [Pseudomonas cichorii]
MARKEFNEYEAVSAVIPGEGGYSAAIAVKALEAGGAPRFHPVLAGEKFKTAHDADLAAAQELERLIGVDVEAELVWANE